MHANYDGINGFKRTTFTQAESYPTTVWMELDHARQGQDQAALEALNRLLEKYYVPLQAHVRYKFKVGREQAADWLQSFIWKKFLLKNLIANVDEQKGKFRTYLLNALDRFVISELRKRKLETLALEQVPETAAFDVGVSMPPDPFDVGWARAVVAQAVSRMRAHCEESPRSRLIWQVFYLRLYQPLLEGEDPIPYKQLVRQLGFETEIQAGNALITAKRMFQRYLREVICEYLKCGSDIEAEIRDLISIFAAN